MRKQALLVGPYPIGSQYPLKGGAQRVALQVADSMAQLGWRVDIQCGNTGRMAGSPDSSAYDLVISSDRLLPWEIRSPKVLLLSTLAYANERKAAAGSWDSIWVPSRYLADELSRTVSRRGDSVRVVPPVVEEQACQCHGRCIGETIRQSSFPRILFPHRLDARKGLGALIDVAKRMATGNIMGSFFVTGAGQFTEDGDSVLKSTLAGASPNLRVLPWLEQTEIWCCYRAADVTITWSQMEEGFGLVPVESVVAGTPALTSSGGNLAYLLENVPGMTRLPVGNMTTVIDAIREVSAHPVSREQQNAVARMFGSETQVQCLTEALAHIVSVDKVS